VETLFRWHDKLTEASKWLAVLLLVAIAFSFSYEVLARYVFNAPTQWANAFVAYFLGAAIFLVVPELTRANSHVTINLIYDALPPGPRRALEQFARVVAGCMCLFAAWFCGTETFDQFRGGIETISAWPIPKWWISIFVPYGFASAALYFFRQLREAPAPQTESIIG
jgi:TRAP-type C4-dicarboxylate transport system permease small subunit